MLQNMHDKMQGLIAGTIAAIIALTFALWGIQNLRGGAKDQPVAEVNGEEITQEQLHIAYERVKRNEMLRSGPDFSLDQKMQLQIKQDVLQRLIEDQAVLQAETKMGLVVSKKQLLAMVSSMPIFQVDGRFSISRFQQIVHDMFRSEQEFLTVLEHSLLHTQLENGIANSGFVLPMEIETIKKIFKQQRDFGYFIVAPGRFEKTVKITPAEIQKYYEAHQSEFLVPEKISIQYIELTSNKISPTVVKTTEEQLKQYYQNHIDSFSTPKKWYVTRILLPLSFKTDAKTDENSRKKMEGLIASVKTKTNLENIASDVRVTTSWVTREEISPDFGSQLDKMTAGQVSAPFRTKDGYNLVKILSVEPAKATPYESVVSKVKQLHERELLTKAFSDASDRLADLAYTNPDSLDGAAKELGLQIQETELFANAIDSSRQGILANNKIIKVAFSDAVLKQHYNSNLIEIGGGKVVVLRIKNHIPETIQPLAQVQDVVMQKLKKQALKESAADFADTVLKELHSGKSEIQLAQQHNLIWKKIVGAKYGQNGEGVKLIDAAFELTKPKNGAVSAIVVNLEGEYAVLRLDKVYEEVIYKNNPKTDEVLKSLPEKLGNFDYQLFLKNLRQQAEVKIIGKVEDK